MVAFWNDLQIVAVAVAYFCAVYALAVWTTPNAFAVGIAMLVASDLASGLGPRSSLRDVVPFAIVTPVVMLLTRRVIGDRERRAQLAERERDLAAREAVVVERARIARELHDVVAHSVSVMVVQAQAGPRLAGEPEEVSRAFRSIESSGREALVELRRLLGVLRSDDQASTAPQPGLGALEALVHQVRAAGLHVDVRVEGEPRTLPPGVDLTAYRILQEALTNTLRHAGGAEAEVVLSYHADILQLEVLDNGVGPRARVEGAGQGLVGMRERVGIYGGTLQTGHRNGHGFAVRAQLPIDPETGK